MKKIVIIIVSLFMFNFSYGEIIVKKGESAPNFSLFPLKGKKISLKEFKDKKVVLINVFSITCLPCKEELPGLIKASSEYKENLQIIGITLDKKKDEVERFAKENKINFPVCLDYTKEFLNKYLKGKFDIPISIFVGLDGNITEIHQYVNEKTLRKILEDLIKK
ncbi:MAG: TlpA disulfide reductase family protein [Candidatus Firestonebacteria bacterium]